MPSHAKPADLTFMRQTIQSMRRSDGVWVLTLAIISLLAATLSVFVFMPGGSNTDSIWQRKQIMDLVPLSDWHPPIMTVAWKLLYEITGTQASLLYLQVSLLFLCSWALALFVFEISQSRRASLAVSLILLLPHLYIYVGSMWKDTQMACAFLISLVAVLVARKHSRLRWLLISIAFIALVYGTSVRKNAFFAAIPLAFLIYCAMRRRDASQRNLRTNFVGFASASAALLLAVGLTSAAINIAATPVHTNQIAQVMLDDVIFTVPKKEIKESSAPKEMKRKLIKAQKKCAKLQRYEDSYWACYGRGKDGIYTSIADPQALTEIWIDRVVHRPDRYLAYRTQTFSHFLFDNYHGWDGANVSPNTIGVKTTYPQINDAARTYVGGIGWQFPWLFGGWFWLASGVTVLACAKRIRRLEIRSEFSQLTLTTEMISLSAVVYIIGYFPIVPANHYRYIYWPALGMTVVFALISTAWFMARKSRNTCQPGQNPELLRSTKYR